MYLLWSTSEKIILFIHETIQWERENNLFEQRVTIETILRELWRLHYSNPTRRAPTLFNTSVMPWVVFFTVLRGNWKQRSLYYYRELEIIIFSNLRRLNTLILWQPEKNSEKKPNVALWILFLVTNVIIVKSVTVPMTMKLFSLKTTLCYIRDGTVFSEDCKNSRVLR